MTAPVDEHNSEEYHQRQPVNLLTLNASGSLTIGSVHWPSRWGSKPLT
jgi:hypothetical protein